MIDLNTYVSTQTELKRDGHRGRQRGERNLLDHNKYNTLVRTFALLIRMHASSQCYIRFYVQCKLDMRAQTTCSSYVDLWPIHFNVCACCALLMSSRWLREMDPMSLAHGSAHSYRYLKINKSKYIFEQKIEERERNRVSERHEDREKKQKQASN